MPNALSLPAAAVFTALVAAPPAGACTCRCQGDAAAMLREIPLLFRGSPEGGSAAGAMRRYAFAVRVVYRGEVADRLVVTTPAETAACGANFVLGQEVLVGGFPGANEVRANNCTQFCLGEKQEEVERLLARCTPGKPCPPEG